MAARHSRRRKGAARRKSRRAVTRTVHRNAPRRAKRRGRHVQSVHFLGKPATRARFRKAGFRRNPGGITGTIMAGLGNGAVVIGGEIVQNNIVRYIPDLLPATMASAPMLNGLLKDVGGIVAGAFAAVKVLGPKRGEFFLAGQVAAAIARVLRATNVPVLSTSLGEYDPMRLGIYSPGLLRPVVAHAALPPARGNNVSTLKGVGIYADGMSMAPSLY